MKRLTIALLLLVACREIEDQHAPCTYMFIQPLDLLYPEDYYRTVSPEVVDLRPSWENKAGWYHMAIFNNDPHGRVRIGYADSLHPGYPDILTTSDSIRYYDSVVGHQSSAVVPAAGALSAN